MQTTLTGGLQRGRWYFLKPFPFPWNHVTDKRVRRDKDLESRPINRMRFLFVRTGPNAKGRHGRTCWAYSTSLPEPSGPVLANPNLHAHWGAACASPGCVARVTLAKA